MKIGYIVGSLSAESINRGLSKVLKSLAPEGVELFELPIKDLPVYNRDVDGNFPQAALDLKEGIEGADGIILITPEHNRMGPRGMAQRTRAGPPVRGDRCPSLASPWPPSEPRLPELAPQLPSST